MIRLHMVVPLIIGCFTQFLSAYLINAMSSFGAKLTIDQLILAVVKCTSIHFDAIKTFAVTHIWRY